MLKAFCNLLRVMLFRSVYCVGKGNYGEEHTSTEQEFDVDSFWPIHSVLPFRSLGILILKVGTSGIKVYCRFKFFFTSI
jgi:hypothetical protein